MEVSQKKNRKREIEIKAEKLCERQRKEERQGGREEGACWILDSVLLVKVLTTSLPSELEHCLDVRIFSNRTLTFRYKF